MSAKAEARKPSGVKTPELQELETFFARCSGQGRKDGWWAGGEIKSIGRRDSAL
jgi:hypothetical protein